MARWHSNAKLGRKQRKVLTHMDRLYWAALLFAVLAVTVVFGVVIENHGKRVRPSATANIENSHYVLPKQIGNFGLPKRRVFPYSVIPGGVDSTQELQNAVAHDGVVLRHYADFDLSRARIIRLDRDREMYVSYRLGDHVYWTKKKLKLRKGESVVTDGKHEARTRCGNRLSDTPSEPVSPIEPSTEALEAAPDPVLFVETRPPFNFQLPTSVTPTNPPGGDIVPPVYPIIFTPGAPGGTPPSAPVVTPPGAPGGTPPSAPVGTPFSNPPLPDPPPPVATPEPGTLILLATGLGVFAVIRKARKN